MAGLYIHIPFCESRCIYCGFYSTTSLKMRDTYVDALCREMELRPIPKALGDGENIETIYLGGGTPSQLTGDQLIRLFDAIRQNYLQSGFPDDTRKEELSAQKGHETSLPEMEITMECNPDDVTEEFCETLKLLPVNRVSMGAQTFSDHRLRFLHRRHNAAEVKTAVERLRGKGMPSVNGYGKGDLYVKILVWIPHKLSRSEKEAIEEMRNSSSFKPDPTRDDRALFEKESKYF